MKRGILAMGVWAGMAVATWADPAQTEAFLKEVALKRGYINANYDGVYLRWTKPVAVSFHGGSDEARARVEEAGAALNDALQGTGIRCQFSGGFSPAADVLFFLDPRDQFAGLAVKYGFTMSDVPGFTFWTDLSVPTHALTKGVVCLDPAAFPGEQLERMALRLLASQLGASGSSKIYPGTIFFPGYVKSGQGHALSDLDKAALRFLMRDLHPGANEDDLARVFASRGAAVTAAAEAAPPAPAP